METNIEETIEYFKGVHFDALNTVAEDMLHFTEKKEKRATKETSETSATDTDTRNDAKTDANLLTSEIVIICKFIEKDVLNGTTNKIVGIHVLIDRVTVFRRGIVVTERKTPLCNSNRRIDAWGKPLNLPASERTYEQKRFETYGNLGGMHGGVVGIDPQIAAHLSKSRQPSSTFGSGRGSRSGGGGRDSFELRMTMWMKLI